MNNPVPPTSDDPLESWCAICANRKLPPGEAYCHDCRPTYERFQEGLERKPGRRLARAFFGIPSGRATPLVRPATPTRSK
jgi:hypothetical protein